MPLSPYCLYQAKALSQFHIRTFFGFARKPKWQPKPVDLDPGLGVMAELNARLSQGTRPQPVEDIVQAFTDFFRARLALPRPLEDIQVQHAFSTFTFLTDTPRDKEHLTLSSEIIRVALNVLGCAGKNDTRGLHATLASHLFEELNRRRNALPDEESSTVAGKDLLAYLRVLSCWGDPIQARALVERYWQSNLIQFGRASWTHVLHGFAREKNSPELLKTLESMHAHEIPFDSQVHGTISLYFADQGDVEMTKKWYQHPIANSQSPLTHTDESIMLFCIRNNELDWGSPIFRNMLERNPDTNRAWNIIFQWAAAQGKGADEIERMMKVMVRRSTQEGNDLQPTSGTINNLVKLANHRNDPYTAERYINLGQKWGIEPNAHTFLLQLEYRIKVCDLDGAHAVYAQLLEIDIPDNKHHPLINRFVTALCAEKVPNFQRIMDIVAYMNEDRMMYEPETVCALARLHLRRNEMSNLVDLLNTHAFHYGSTQRATIRSIFVEFCLDRSNSIARVWDAYSVLRQVFREIELEAQTKLMTEFFSRERSDMACHVFGHMRQKAVEGRRPNIDTYIACFEGIAVAADIESLESIHNMLKVDHMIEPNTKLYNSLMLAYMACGEPQRSLDFWNDIMHSREGPSYHSIQIALRACEKMSLGDLEARKILDKLQKLDIRVTKEIYTAHVGAMADQALFDETKRLIDDAEKATGYPPDTGMLGTFYNAIPGAVNKDRVEDWALRAYPSLWNDLLKLGQRQLADGQKVFSIDKDVKP